ncbi:MAG: LuxR C-terminal-related transcriptional regulator [Pseudomonadales bacterium]
MQTNTTEKSKPNTVAIVEDNRDVLDTFCLAVENSQHCQLLGCYSRLDLAIAGLSKPPMPDVVFVDLELPDGRGSELIRQLANAKTRPQMIVYTSFADGEHLFQALRAGADGYLLKQDVEPQQVDEFVASVLRGESPMSGSIARRCMKYFDESNQEQTDPDIERLTQREEEILALVAQGKTANQVADTLGIAPSNVRTRMRTIYQILNVHNKVDAANRYNRLQRPPPL